MTKDIEVLLSADQIQTRVAELAKEIERDIPDNEEFVVVGVLKGSFIFMADLIRNIDRPLTCDFVRVSSYEKDKSTGIVRFEFDTTQPITGKHVLLVEDIVDTGRTLKALLNHMKHKKPASFKVASLLYKDMKTDMRQHIDYLGFEVPHKFVVGYGLDYEGHYRALPFVGIKS
jgi:hypoxanthine phosphoribosyltransferase